MKPKTPILRCHPPFCRKRARFFGRFAGGVCAEHAKEVINDLHPADRARLEAEMNKKDPRKLKRDQIAFVLQYFRDRSQSHDAHGNYYSYSTETTPSYDDGMYFCDEFNKVFPGRKPDPNLTHSSARLSKLLRGMTRDGWMIRWRLGNQQQCPGDPKWQYCYKLPPDVINALKQGDETPESLATRYWG